MKKITTVILTLLVLTASGKVRDDGSMSSDGKIFRMLYIETNDESDTFKEKLINKLGEPIYLDKHQNVALFENYNFYGFNNIDIRISFIKSYKIIRKIDGSRERKFEDQTIGFVFIDNNGNDLLEKKTDSKKKLKKILSDLIKEIKTLPNNGS